MKPGPLDQNSEHVGHRLGSPPPTFEGVGLYDAPQVAVGQLIGGVGGVGPFMDAFLSPNRLSPEERLSVADRLVGPRPSALVKTAVEVVTNPWIMLGFLTSPLGGKSLKQGKSIFAVRSSLSGFAARSSPWYHNLLSPLEIFDEASTVALETSEHIRTMGARARGTVAAAEESLLNRFDALLGRKGKWHENGPLDLSNYRKGTPEYNLVESWNEYDMIRGLGLETDRTDIIPEVIYSIKKKKGRGDAQWVDWEPSPDLAKQPQGYVLEAYRHLKKEADQAMEQARVEWDLLSKKEKAKWIGSRKAMEWTEHSDWEAGFRAWYDTDYEGALRYDITARTAGKVKQSPALFRKDRIDEFGLLFGEEGAAYRAAADRARKDAFVEMIGDEAHYKETGLFRVDKEKGYRFVSSLNRKMREGDNGYFGDLHSGSTSLQGKEAVMSLLGQARFETLKNLGDQAAQMKFVQDSIMEIVGVGAESAWAKGNWASRNVYEAVPVLINGKRQVPTKGLDQVLRSNYDMAPWAASSVSDSHFMPVTERDLHIDPDALEKLDGRGWLTDAGKEAAAKTRNTADSVWAKHRKGLMSLRLDGHDMHRRYLNNVHQSTAIDTAMAGDGAIREDAEALSKIHPEVRGRKTVIGAGFEVDVGEDLSKYGEKGRRLVSRGDLMDRFYSRLRDPMRQQRFRDVLVPGALNNAGPEWISVYNSHLRTKEMAAWFADSGVGKFIEGINSTGRDFIARVRDIGDMNRAVRHTSFSDGLAKWFYASHLGINAASMLVNLTQPLLLAAAVGNTTDVLGAYKDSMVEMFDYARKRLAIPKAFLTNEEKLGLIQSSFKFADHQGKNLIGIGPDVHTMLDSHLARSTGSKTDKFFSLLMKGFEKTEWMNRNTSAHLLSRAYRRAGRSVDEAMFSTDLERFVLQTQFGQNDLNTPLLFQKGVLNNRLLRQFMTFPLRSLTGAAYVFPRMGEESYAKGLFTVTMRGMAASAVLHEVSKGLLGADMSGALFASSVGSIVGGQRILEKGNEVFPLPPVLSIPVDFVRGWANEDSRMLTGAVARLVPGGVALNRAMGFTGEWPRFGSSGFPGNLQTQYVGWGEVQEDGTVPVYKGDGSLVGFRSPSSIVLKAFGADMGSWKTSGDLDNYLVKQREEILKARHEFVRALGANEIGRATAIRKDFERRFGIPLTVKDSQLKDYLSSRSTPRQERILSRLPADVRGRMPSTRQGGVAEGGRPRTDPGALGDLQKRRDAVGPAARSFSSFGEP